MKKRRSKYADIMVRATVMGLMNTSEDVDRMMDMHRIREPVRIHFLFSK